MVCQIYACPKCRCRDLRPVYVTRDGREYRYFKVDNASEVQECFKCGWRQETPREAGKRIAQEAFGQTKEG